MVGYSIAAAQQLRSWFYTNSQWMFVFVRVFVWKYLTRKYSLFLVNKVLAYRIRDVHSSETLLHIGVISVRVGGVQPVVSQGCAYTSSIHSGVIVGLVEEL